MSNKFYTNVEVRGNNILYRGYENGIAVSKKIPYRPHLFVPSETETKWKSFSTKQFVKKVDFDSIDEFKGYISQYEDVGNFNLFGCENVVRQYIANSYRGDIDWQYLTTQIWFFDIETKTDGAFPKPETALQDILLITMMNHHERKYYTWATKGVDAGELDGYDVDLRVFSDEKSMLKDFLLFWKSKRIDVISGWNSEVFDIPYLVNRMKQVLSPALTNMLSPWGIVKPRTVTTEQYSYTTYDIMGISHLDYLDLYKKFNPGQKESFKLDFIAEYELGDRKLEMPGETFRENYEQHWSMFVRYNIVDVELLHKLETKMLQVRLAMQIAYIAKVNYGDVLSSMRIWESIIYSYFLDESLVEDLKKHSNERTKIIGAYVHTPTPGKRGWVVSIDATSLYPSIMMQTNTSPECILGMDEMMSIDSMLAGKHIGNVSEGTILSANGLITSKETWGFIPTLVKRMFDLRKKTKDRMLELKIANAPEQEYRALDVSQNAFKIAANSFYGILALPHFKYYDYRMAEAITSNGQVFIRKTREYVNEIFSKLIGKEDDYAFYLDTDSCYISVDLFVKKHCKGKTDREIVDFIEKIIFDVVQPTLNKKLSALAKTMGVDECRIYFKLECIGNGYIQVAKKRYAFNILYSEGVHYDTPKMKVMGIEIVRSSTPSVVKDYLKGSVKLCLTSTESELQKFVSNVKTEFMKQPYTAISFPRGCNGLATYSDPASIYKKGCPIHVRAALLHNYQLSKLNLTDKYQPIGEGEKIKFVALKVPNPIYENVIGYTTKLPQEFGLEQYIDYNTQFDKAFLNPLQTILDAVGWESEEKVLLDFG